MKRNLLIPSALAAVIATATGCGASSVAHQTTPATASALPTAIPQGHSECAELNGTVRPDHTCHVQSATSAYKIDMSLPLDYPDLRAVTDFLKGDRDEFL